MGFVSQYEDISCPQGFHLQKLYAPKYNKSSSIADRLFVNTGIYAIIHKSFHARPPQLIAQLC